MNSEQDIMLTIKQITGIALHKVLIQQFREWNTNDVQDGKVTIK